MTFYSIPKVAAALLMLTVFLTLQCSTTICHAQETTPPDTATDKPKTENSTTAEPELAAPESTSDATPATDEQPTTIDDRIGRLEERVAHLERLLFSTAQLTAYEAERRLEGAKEQLAQSRRLLLKGVIRQNQVNHDQFLVDRAEYELRLAKATDGQFQISAEIDCLQARYNLQVAEQRLQFSQQQLTRGFVSQQQIRGDQVLVDDARKALSFAEQRLEELKAAELKGLNK